MTLCNHSTIGKLFQLKSPDEKALIDRLEKFNISYKQVNKDLCTISFNEQDYDYEIIDEYVFSSLSSTSKLIVKCMTTDKFFFFIKGNYETVHPLIDDKNDIILIEDILNSDFGFYVKSVLFVFKELTNEEANKFINDLQIAKLSHIDLEKKIKTVYESIEKDMKYLGIAGLEYVIYEENINAIKNLNDAGIKT